MHAVMASLEDSVHHVAELRVLAELTRLDRLWKVTDMYNLATRLLQSQ